MKPVFLCAALAAAPLLAATDAYAQAACAPLKQLASIKVTKSASGQWLVPVTVNNTPTALLLATAAPTSSISGTGADALKLARMEKRNDKLVPSTGSGGPEFVSVESLVMGSGKFTDSEFRIENARPGQAALPNGASGQLGLDILTRFDFDLDFATGTLNLFDLNHCEGQVVYWKTSVAVAMPFIYDASQKIRATVMLDGKEINATIDTASDVNRISLGNAKLLLDFNENGPGVEKLPDDEAGNKHWKITAKALEFEGLGVQNAPIIVTELKPVVSAGRAGGRPPNAARVSVDTRPGELTIGIGTLSKLRVYVASKERKIYVSPPAQ